MKKDLLNKKIGKLKVIEYCGSKIVGKNKLRKKAFWKCRCDCGNITIVEASNLNINHTTSCGCYKKKVFNNIEHGMRHTRFYIIWRNMKSRCNDIDDLNYGGRDIKICDKWQKFENFRDNMYKNYLNHVKRFGKKDTTIDRINNNGNYELNNCRWATYKEQGNNKRNNKFINYNNTKLNISRWENKLAFKSGTLYNRIFKYGWNIEKAFSTPVKHFKYG